MTTRRRVTAAYAGQAILVLAAMVFGMVVLAGHGAQAFGPVGREFQASTYTTADQGGSATAVAADPSGNFVVVWDSSYSDQDGDGVGVFGQRFDGNGARLGSEFQVNTYTTGNQGQGALSVAADAAGNFVVVWGGEGAGDYAGIFGRRFNSAGNPVGAEFQVNSYSTGSQGDYRSGVSVAADPAGNFIVVWSGEGPGDDAGVFGRRFDDLGAPQGGDFLVNTYTTSGQGVRAGAAVATDAAGNFVVVWDSYTQDGDIEGVFGQRFDSAGNALGTEFQVNTYTTGDQGYRSVAVASDAAGNFVVAWESTGAYPGQDGSSSGVFAQRYDSAGNTLGGEFQVNTYTLYRQGYGGHFDASYGGIAVAADPAGDFVVVWDSDYDADQDGSGFGVFAQRFDSAGNPRGDEFQVNAFTTEDQTLVAAAASGAGRFVVAWASRNESYPEQSQDGSYTGVFGRTLSGLIRGKLLLVKDPNGDESKRRVVVIGRETPSDIGPSIAGDPVSNGATLRIVTNGTTDSDQTYVLDSAGWTQTRTGFRYSGPTGADGDPVQKIVFKRGRNDKVFLRAVLKGSVGTQPLNVVPPNTGTDGGAILTINGGGTYCITLGASAGSQVGRDTAEVWRLTNAATQPGCPSP